MALRILLESVQSISIDTGLFKESYYFHRVFTLMNEIRKEQVC